MIQTDADSSLISARLDLIDEIPNFLEIHFFEILNIIGGIAASLLFLYFNSTLFVFSFSIISVALIPAVTYRYQKGIVENNKQHKNLEEERMNQIAGRDKLAYKRYIQNLLKISISNSDLDTKIFLWLIFFK